ncbi:hypothetical protein AVEN_114367-1 [Araneus ventricosus]|uniref:Uncharacterized protein n=1 Tax=Araneus ventricosus TaxID=182803 RepID=A0A4Y2JSR4_ARAVE|nr:hypothetical protein AVEN_52298-1 [Araneus ventricosus]GBM93090.1 hypothetical protein AVEN_69000-1 [Araneus ventricosus]GBM93453.1 hypothetical protein AVEN_21183-1 [Araneus ventricosus]GBM93470.1 hypothetical protein AVEN_114367-1 [Araneus ventricosus]
MTTEVLTHGKMVLFLSLNDFLTYKRSLPVTILQNWQILWDHSKKLFYKVDEKRVLSDFYSNQIITGHGAFKTHQNRFFGKSPWCFCGKEEGTVEHTILKCDAWQDIRDT